MKDCSNIRHLIFDVGDVLLSYRWKDMLIDHGLTEEEALYVGEHVFGNPYWSIYDYGTEPEEVIIKGLQKIYPEYAEAIEWFITHDELMHLPRPEVFSLVHELKQCGYGIYLLSNYPERFFHIHTDDMPFMNDVDGMVISYQVHMVKPDPRIYQHLLRKYGLKAEECAFFDDRSPNVRAAKKAGFMAFHVRSEAELIKILKELRETK